MKYAYAAGLFLACVAQGASASVLTFGDEDCLNSGCYGASDPKSGATLQGLAAGVITDAASSFGHGFPFSPQVGDFAGTDQIYVGSVQTGAHDGYSVASERVNGPQTLILDYSSLVGAGQGVVSLTLGLASDDFQFPSLGQPFTAQINGSTDAVLTAKLNTVDEGGPQAHFFTIGLDPLLDTAAHTLTVTIDQRGDGGDGWAMDFLTVGVTTAPIGLPEPVSLALFGVGLAGLGFVRRRARC